MLRSRKLYLNLFLFLAIILVIGFIKFYYSIKNTTVYSNQNIQGIAILTGGKGRISEGIKLFLETQNSILLITGVDKKVDSEQIVPARLLKNPKVFIDKNSDTTLDNANAIIQWATVNKITNVLVVTSDYHMPRSMLVLKKKSKKLNFYPYLVTSNIRLEEKLLKDSKVLRFMLEEYFKYLLCFFL